jgi:hypothetical protein
LRIGINMRIWCPGYPGDTIPKGFERGFKRLHSSEKKRYTRNHVGRV